MSINKAPQCGFSALRSFVPLAGTALSFESERRDKSGFFAPHSGRTMLTSGNAHYWGLSLNSKV
jgi:hypothetical protein